MSLAASRVVRPSKFRHVFGEPAKVEGQYSDLELSAATGDHNYIRGNGKFFSVAVRGGGGPVLVLPYSASGKLPRGYPVLNGHSAAVYDTAWNPFNDNQLATASDDTTVKIWNIPEGGLTETLKDASVTLSGHGKQVSLLQWHPTASGVLASAAKDPSVKIWDVEKAAARITLEGFGGLVQDMAWSTDGSLLVTSAKDKVARLHDPRKAAADPEAGVIAQWMPHEGGKAFKTVFLGERGQLLTVGFTKQSKREFKIWDLRSVDKPLMTQEIDQAAGVMMPFYDDDTRVLYLTGKGDGNVRYYELVDEAPYAYFLSEYRTNVSTKGADMLPKRNCNALKCEIARMLKLTGDSVEPISFIVPRKSEAFQEDIFPDALAGKPAIATPDEWFAGALAPPVRMSMDPAKNGAIASSTGFKPLAIPAQAPAGVVGSPLDSASRSVSHGFTPAATIHEQDEASAERIAALEAQVKDLEERLRAANARISELEAAQAPSAEASA